MIGTIGVILAIVGFGSAAARYLDGTTIDLMKWAEDLQPYAGLALGALGVVLVLAEVLMRRTTGR